MSDNVASIDEIPESEQIAPPAPTPPRRGPGHRGQDVRDTMAEMAAKAHEISLEAGSKMAGTMREVIGAAAGLTAFAIESARDLVQYMVRRGQMTQDEADKLMREVEAAHASLPKVPPKAEPSKSDTAPKNAQSPTAAPVSVSPSALVTAPTVPLEHHAEPHSATMAAADKSAADSNPMAEAAKAKKVAPAAPAASATRSPVAVKPGATLATKAPTKGPVKAPANLPARVQVKSPVKFPVKSPVKSPVAAPVAAPVPASAKTLAKAAGKAIPKPPTKPPARKAATSKKK